MMPAEIEARPWDQVQEIDDAQYRGPLRYLFERSALYREKLGAAGISSADETGGLAEIARLPLTEKRELRAAAGPEQPIGAHVCVEPAEIVRIYSTSGTAGEPTYIPLTSSDLDNWITGSARSYSASGVAVGERVVTTYNAGRSRRARRSQRSSGSASATYRSAPGTRHVSCTRSGRCPRGPRC